MNIKKQHIIHLLVLIKVTCKAICLSATNDGCIFPISFFGGIVRSILDCCMLACKAAKSLYLRDTDHLFSTSLPFCTRKTYS